MRPSAPDQWPQVSARQLRMGRVAGQQQQACNCRECECPKAGSGQAGLAVTTATVCEDHTKWETSRQESRLIVTSNVLIAHWCMLDISTQQTQMGSFFDGISADSLLADSSSCKLDRSALHIPLMMHQLISVLYTQHTRLIHEVMG